MTVAAAVAHAFAVAVDFAAVAVAVAEVWPTFGRCNYYLRFDHRRYLNYPRKN